MLDVTAGFLMAGEFCVVIVSALAAYFERYQTLSMSPSYWFASLLGATLYVNGLIVTRSFSLAKTRLPPYRIGALIGCWGAATLLIVAVLFAAKISEDFSRAWLVLWLATGLVSLVAIRLLAVAALRKSSRLGRLSASVALVGSGHMVDWVASRLRMAEDSFHIAATHRLDRSQLADSAALETVTNDIFRLAQRTRLDDIIVAIPKARPEMLAELVRRLGSLPVTVRVCPWAIDGRQLALVAGMPMYSVIERPLSGWDRIAKRAEDVILSSALLIILLPLMLGTAIAIRLDSPGPTLFRQNRFGFRNELIRIYKFRTMHIEHCTDPSARQATRNDPRITRIGRLLRAMSLDELPQLFNVLKGDMSLVGPRPHPVALNERFAAVIDNYMARHRVRPGITGWAQVNGLRGETDTVEKMDRRVQHDLYYIENWSLLFDLTILWTTLKREIISRNAY
nr:WcaJ_sugtrans: undecaprenyl-phosphate glucose [uncultured bacterium]